MEMIHLFLSIITLKFTYAGNILVTASLGGSRLLAIVEVANILAEAGHNVTLLTPGFDNRVKLNKDIVWTSSNDKDLAATTDKLFTYLLVPEVLNAKTEDGLWTLLKLPTLIKDSLKFYSEITKFYTGDKVEAVFLQGNFDVIVAEEKACIDAALAGRKFRSKHSNEKTIPLVMYFPAPDHFSSRKFQNYPTMIMSEPGFFAGDIAPDRLPTFMNRLGLFQNMVKIGELINVMKEHWSNFLAEYGIDDVEELYDMIQLYLINDHPAFTFPFLDPPNAINVGGFNLHNSEPLSENFHDFLTAHQRPAILLSFGSYAKLDWYPWFKTLLNSLEEMDVSVILKSKEKIELSDKFLVSPWVPQKALLASGLVTIFISHCGNNGRIETIYYNVPVMCIPLFWDQYQNALYIREKGFGIFYRKEDISFESVQTVVTEMIAKHSTFEKNMKQASNILKQDPASGTDKILYYVELLVQYGHLDYLKNNIVKKQSVVEMYNLDIFALIGLLVLIVFVFIVFAVVKACCFAKNKIFKHKTD